LSKESKPQLEPRKTPVQARSTASVEAIRQATIQVLLSVGKEHLTTTKVAQRAGVSVGTLYQYFPNKSSLLQAVLRAHLETTYGAVEAACESAKGLSLELMALALVEGFVKAKLKNVETSRALYFVSDDIGGVEIARGHSSRAVKAIATMLESAQEGLREDPLVVASTVMAAMAGISRRMIEAGRTPKTMQAMRQELEVMVRAYLNACALDQDHPAPRTGVR
jgi:AcrR family transcriptional regulator